MNRILVLGYELPALAQGAVAARSYRTWQLVQPLLEDGCEVLLCVPASQTSESVKHSLSERLTYRRLCYKRPGWMRRLNHWQTAFDPHGILTVMYPNALRATRLRTDTPVWVDMYGDRLAESQIAQLSRGSSRGLYRRVQTMTRIFCLGDVFSTCSEPQRYSTIGQLAIAGRLNRHTVGYEFVYPILPGVFAPQQSPLSSDDRKRLRQRVGLPMGDDACVVLWCGGYNVWTDVNILFRGLEGAMEREPGLHFLSVGAAADVSNNNTYDRFLGMIKQSPYRQRFKMMGWQPVSQVPDYYRMSDVGISLDMTCYEAELGTRTRLVEMISYGLPVITSLGCELSAIIGEQRLGMTFPIGDAGAFQDRLAAMAQSGDLRRELAERAGRYTREHLTFGVTTAPLRRWARSPWRAPDKLVSESSPIQSVVNAARFLARSVLWQFLGLDRLD